MPAIETHYCFALDEGVLKKKYPFAYFLGTQGPDPFFFFGQRPWKRRPFWRNVVSFGIELHHSDLTNPYFLMLEEIKRRPSEDQELLYSYMEGLFYHYVLDRNCHPYIISRAGYALENDDKKMKKQWQASHTYLETLIDLLIAEEHHVFTRKAYRYLEAPYQELVKISSLWLAANQTLKKEGIDEHSYLLALNDYRKVLKLTNVPHFYSLFLTTILMGKKSQVRAMNYPLKMPKKYRDVDFLNKNHTTWLDPVSGKKRDESFLDLMQKAHEEASYISGFLKRYRQNESNKEELRKFVNGIDHEGFSPSSTKKYKSVIWPAYQKERR